MPEACFNLIRNQLLSAIPQEEYDRLLPHLETINLASKQVLYTPTAPIQYVYFPSTGIISLVNFTNDGGTVEAVMVGNEGMVGIPILLGDDRILGQAVVQVHGEALRMKADVFKRIVTPDTTLHDLLLRYTLSLIYRLSQSVACNSRHSIESRCCRWLLTCQDRVQSDEFPLTQELLSQMLGVRRSSVSVVAALLQRAGLIRYSRGKMAILDREGLEAASCECYRIVQDEFERLLGGELLRLEKGDR